MTGRDYLTSALADNVRTLIESRGRGHCLLVPNLPEWLADEACQAIYESSESGAFHARTVVQTSAHPWQATPTKAVELRNATEETEGKLVLFVPSGTQLAAEDSFGRSTFEIFDVGDLERRTVRLLEEKLSELDPQLGDEANRVLAAIDEKTFGIDDGHKMSYLARLLREPKREEVGRALTEFGLLPDAGIAAYEDDQIEARLNRNLQQMRTLTEIAPPEERVRSLPLDRERPESPGIVGALLEATRAADADRFSIAEKLDANNRASTVDFAEWHLDVTAIRFDEFRVMQLTGDFSKETDQTVTKKANASLGVRISSRPAPSNLTGLKELVLDLMRVGDELDDLSETGVQAAKRGKNLPGRRDFRWAMRVPTQDPELGEGIYRLRVRAFNEDNLEIARSISDPFRIGDVEPPRRRVAQVPSIAAAVVAATVEGGTRPAIEDATLEISASSTKDDASDPRMSVAIRFEDHSDFWELGISRLLARLENYTLDDPDSRGIYAVEIDTDEIAGRTAADTGTLPQRFLEARTRAFEKIILAQTPVQGEQVGPLVGFADLVAGRDAIDDYLVAWTDALAAAETDGERRALLDVDQVSVTERGVEVARLLAPTHPLRLAWLCRYQHKIDERLGGGVTTADAHDLSTLLQTLRPANVPHVVIGERQPLRHSEPLDLGWGLWAPADGRSTSVIAARIRPWLFGESSATATVSTDQLVTRIRRYLVAHPFVDQILLNFVQPGAARVVLDALLALQREPRFADLRYVIRLFANDLSRTELGAALDDFMANPEAARTARRDEADAFLAASDDPLFPKLTYSKHPVSDLMLQPEAYPAHVTFLLDWFDLRIIAAAPTQDRRSLFGDALIVDPVVTYRAGTELLNPQWDSSILGLDGDDTLIAAYSQCGERTAQIIGGGEPGLVPALRLDLDRVRRSVLDAVHRSSDWVVVVDPVFGDDLLDAPSSGEQRYLIDYVGDERVGSVRHVVVSTRSRRELIGLLAPITATYELDVEEGRVEALLDGLQVLGAGLPLKLLNNRTQAFEALSLSLASLYLAERGIFRRALAIPLDLHQELFREYANLAADPDPGLRRTDVAILRVAEEGPGRQLHFQIRLYEVKARQSLPEQTPVELVEHIAEQLENSRAALRARLFGADLSRAQRALEGATQTHRLARTLTHYAERAHRYGYLDAEELATVRRAATRLGHDTFQLSFEKHALLFDFDGESQIPESINGVVVTRIGRAQIDDLLSRARTPAGTEPFAGSATVVGGTDLPSEPDKEVDRTLAHDAPGPVLPMEPEPPAVKPVRETEIVEAIEVHEPVEVTTTPAPPEDLVPEDDHRPPERGEVDGPDPESVLLLGSLRTSPQFGVIGQLRGAQTPVAIDLDGTNTICIFGAPGYGKSYTVGAILESALVDEPTLNRLPSPLAAVVFHYQDDQTYAPEFLSMGEPNDNPQEVDTLRRDYGAIPEGLHDLRVLVPEGLLDKRRGEYPHLSVHPLRLSSGEIDINDWQLLMGLTGGGQIYSRAMNRLFDTIRDDVTIERLREAVASSDTLTQTQKNLARTRIDFAAPYVGDVSPLSDHLQPGRLIVVDLRDPLIAQDEALALFMVLLRTFGQVQRTEEFNKLFVFDEAHKYMRDPQLRESIDRVIRERRHRGTTIAIASQDPPSVPSEIIGFANVLVAHTFTVPGWLEYLRKAKVAFAEADLKPSQLAQLAPGEAFVWSEGGAEVFQRPQRVLIRPRMTRHGGATRRATR